MATKNPIVAMGIDPGYDRCGFVVVEHSGKLLVRDYGYITSDVHTNFEHRIAEIGNDFKKLLTQYKPQYIFIEQVFFSKNKQLH